MGRNLEVLVLDDEAIVCDRLKDYLEKKNISVETYTVSSAALNRLREKAFDVVVTDLKMDGPTGMDVLRAVKKGGRSTEVIMITGYASIETSHEAEAVGAFKFIAKPFKMSEVHKLIEKAAKKAHKGK